VNLRRISLDRSPLAKAGTDMGPKAAAPGVVAGVAREHLISLFCVGIETRGLVLEKSSAVEDADGATRLALLAG
jgi:hypothetical protein